MENKHKIFDDDGNLTKISFKVVMYPGENGVIKKGVFIGGELLDWSIDVNSLIEAQNMGPSYVEEMKKQITKHYTESVSDFVGHKVSMEDIFKAIKTGWLELK